MLNVIAISAQQENGTKHAGRLSFNHAHECRENVTERRIDSNHLFDLLLSGAEGFFIGDNSAAELLS